MALNNVGSPLVLAVFLVVPLAAVALGGCGKKCKLPGDLKKELLATPDPATLPEAKRTALLRRAVKGCSRWSKPVKKTANQALPDFPGSFALPYSRFPNSMKAQARACPFLESPSYGSITAWERAQQVWTRCVKKLGIMTRSEALKRPGHAIFAVMIYKTFKASGLNHKVSRGLVRAWLGPDPYGQLEAVGVHVPKTDSYTLALPRLSLFVAKGRAAAAQSPRGPLQWSSPSVLVAKLQQNARFQRQPGALAVFANTKTPYNVLHPVLHSIRRAAGKGVELQLAAWHPNEGLRAVPVLVATPPATPAASPSSTLALTLEIKPGGFAIRSRHGSECPEGLDPASVVCFQTGHLQDLRLHLWYLFERKYKSCSHYASDSQACVRQHHTLRVVGHSKLSYAALMRVLDAVRERPRKARNPPVNNVPHAGCLRKWDKTTGQLAPPASPETACLYWRIKLLAPKLLAPKP